MKQRIASRFAHESKVCQEVFKLIEEKHPHSFKSGKNECIKFFRIKYYLLARGMELSMKAFLFDHGTKLNELRSKKVGHNIEALIKKCQEKEFPALSISEMRHIKLLNRAYYKKGLEYDNNIFQALPDLGKLKELAEKIIGEISKKL